MVWILSLCQLRAKALQYMVKLEIAFRSQQNLGDNVLETIYIYIYIYVNGFRIPNRFDITCGRKYHEKQKQIFIVFFSCFSVLQWCITS